MGFDAKLKGGSNKIRYNFGVLFQKRPCSRACSFSLPQSGSPSPPALRSGLGLQRQPSTLSYQQMGSNNNATFVGGGNAYLNGNPIYTTSQHNYQPLAAGPPYCSAAGVGHPLAPAADPPRFNTQSFSTMVNMQPFLAGDDDDSEKK